MVKERIDDLIDILSEEYARLENTLLIRNNEQLVKFMQNPESWKKQQMLSRNAYKRELVNNAKDQIKQLNDKLAKVMLLSYKEVEKDIIEVSETEIKLTKPLKEVESKINELKKMNALEVANLTNIAFKTYTTNVRIVEQLSTPETLYEVVKKQLPKGIENGLNVVYKDGKEMNWKSYMEMNIRTTVHQEMTEHQVRAGARANQVFYICDSFGDCADDHADYQGKIYYNADTNIPEDAQRYIDENNILSMQEVIENEPFLTSRPNCRHNFHAISIEEVLGKSSDEILEDNGFKFGDYEKSNYKALQQQRYNERQIRKWKTRAENQKQIEKETGIKSPLLDKKYADKVSEWQSKQRQLIKDNKEVLKRDYQRESAKILVDDLGVKYDYKVVDGELVKK